MMLVTVAERCLHVMEEIVRRHNVVILCLGHIIVAQERMLLKAEEMYLLDQYGLSADGLVVKKKVLFSP